MRQLVIFQIHLDSRWKDFVDYTLNRVWRSQIKRLKVQPKITKICSTDAKLFWLRSSILKCRNRSKPFSARQDNLKSNDFKLSWGFRVSLKFPIEKSQKLNCCNKDSLKGLQLDKESKLKNLQVQKIGNGAKQTVAKNDRGEENNYVFQIFF